NAPLIRGVEPCGRTHDARCVDVLKGVRPADVVVPDRRRRQGTFRKRDSNRSRRGGSDSVAARLDRSSGQRHASSRYGLQGRDRPRPRPASARNNLTRPRAKPAVAAAVGLAACSLVACGGGQKQKAETPCPTKGKQVTFPLLDKSTPHTVNVLTNLGSFDIRLDVQDSPCPTSSFAARARQR